MTTLPGKAKKLIISADDFGLHTSIDEAVEIGYCKGVITNASLVACGDSFEGALKIAGRNKGLGVGIHITLVGERPLADPKRIKTIVDEDGMLFEDHMKLFSRICAGRVDMEHIAIECEEQLTRLVKSGISLTHADSHQHIHMLPSVFRTIKPALDKFGIKRVRGFNIPWFDYNCADLKKMAFSIFARLSRPLKNSECRTPDYFIGFFKSGRADSGYVRDVIKKIGSGITELNLHPGTDNMMIRKRYGHLNKRLGWPCNWERELTAVLDPLVKEAVIANEIALTNYLTV